MYVVLLLKNRYFFKLYILRVIFMWFDYKRMFITFIIYVAHDNNDVLFFITWKHLTKVYVCWSLIYTNGFGNKRFADKRRSCEWTKTLYNCLENTITSGRTENTVLECWYFVLSCWSCRFSHDVKCIEYMRKRCFVKNTVGEKKRENPCVSMPRRVWKLHI